MQSYRIWLLTMIAAAHLLAASPGNAQFVQQGAKLVGTGGVGMSAQGQSVSLSADGNTALVGGYRDSSFMGAAWIFTRSGSVWTQQGGKLLGLDTAGNGLQGMSAAISDDGNTAVVGGFGDSGFVGAAWVFTRSGGVWTQQGPKLVGTGSVGLPRQGKSIAISGDGNTFIMGGFNDDTSVGAAWVFTRSGGVWAQQGPKLVGAGNVGPSSQGLSVAISSDGNTAIVGGQQDNSFTGAAWVFTRSGGAWTQQGSKLVGTGGAGAPRYGSAVALSADGNTAMVGGWGDAIGKGATWVFTRSGGVWTQQGGKLVGTGAAGAAQQGISVALSADGNTAVIGASEDNASTGAIWFFTRSAGVWSQLGSKLVGTGGVGATYQGLSVALSDDGNTAFAGGVGDDSGRGATWVHARPGEPKLTGVTDVPADQGGFVRLAWTKSAYDNALSYPPVGWYSIWRKLPGGATPAATRPWQGPAAFADTTVAGFEFIMSAPATQAASYQLAVPTPEDSSASGTPWFTYLVAGRTTGPDTAYVSASDSGYSRDNLPPSPPAGLVATILPGPQVGLSWDPPVDPDVDRYIIHHSTTDGFTPSPGTVIDTTDTTACTHTTPSGTEVNYYRVVAVDVHDNAGGASDQASASSLETSEFGVLDQWNIVSVPLQMSDYTTPLLFPGAISDAFAYESGYVTAPVLDNGRGYWVKFDGPGEISHDGVGRSADTVDVAEGWNMVGSLSTAIPVVNVGSIPGGIVTSGFFGYASGYSPAIDLEPGKGYWVKSSSPGQLILSTSGMAPSARIRIEETGEKPPPPPFASGPGSPVPAIVALEQNYPNPFNAATTISYDVAESGPVTILVYDVLGRVVGRLVEQPMEPGSYRAAWNAGEYPTGVYYLRMEAGGRFFTHRMLLMK